MHQVAYHGFGAVRAQRGGGSEPFGFVGNERDAVRLYDFKARPYRAELAVFLSPDPAALHEPQKVLEEPSKAYPYVFSGNDPYTQRDASGEWFDTVVDVAFIAFDVGVIVKENIIEERTDTLPVNVAALALDVGCAFIPVATGGGVAVRGGAKALEHTGVVLFHAGTKRAGQAQIKAGQMGAHQVVGPKPGPYSHLQDPPTVGPGKEFAKAQKRNILGENYERNNGKLRDDVDGRFLSPPKQSQKGVAPSPHEAQIDHVVPRQPANPNTTPGSNSYSNAAVRARRDNRAKSNK